MDMFLVQEPPAAPSTGPRSGAPCLMLATQPGTHPHSAARPKKLLRWQTIEKQNRIWTKKGGGWQRTGGPAHNKVSLVASPCLPRFRPSQFKQWHGPTLFVHNISTSYLDTLQLHLPPTGRQHHPDTPFWTETRGWECTDKWSIWMCSWMKTSRSSMTWLIFI